MGNDREKSFQFTEKNTRGEVNDTIQKLETGCPLQRLVTGFL